MLLCEYTMCHCSSHPLGFFPLKDECLPDSHQCKCCVCYLKINPLISFLVQQLKLLLVLLQRNVFEKGMFSRVACNRPARRSEILRSSSYRSIFKMHFYCKNKQVGFQEEQLRAL
uniref:Uncharacterized protein n=1 Tax=Sphaerodactylus townsendi TaxID=933632 RepID=A0ACB8FD10_9SAUR